jgi:cyclic-di-GMP-binding protein
MPSFDVVSEIDMHELTNAVDQANREINNRFDFKGTKSRIEQTERTLKLIAPTEFQVTQMQDILYSKLSKRQIDIRCVDAGKITSNLAEAQQEIVIKEGIDKELAKKLVKIVKESKLKVQAAIQGEQVRITGKKRDDLQDAIAMLRSEKTIEMPMQFTNFRD